MAAGGATEGQHVRCQLLDLPGVAAAQALQPAGLCSKGAFEHLRDPARSKRLLLDVVAAQPFHEGAVLAHMQDDVPALHLADELGIALHIVLDEGRELFNAGAVVERHCLRLLGGS